MDSLKQKRGLKKGAITKLLNSKEKIIASIDSSLIQIKLDYLEEVYHEYKEIQAKFEDSLLANKETKEEELENEITERETVMESYAEIKAVITNRLRELNPVTASTTPTTVNCPINEFPHRQKGEVRMPKITLPRFNGKRIEEFKSFFDLFKATIHKASIDDVEKLWYLKGCLESDPLALIDSLPLENESYSEALSKLQKRYDNKKLVVNAHLKAMNKRSAVTTQSATELKKLIDDITSHVSALQNMGYSKEQMWEMNLVFLTADRLDSETRKLWEQSCPEDKPVFFAELTKFIEQQAQILDIITPKEAPLGIPVKRITNTAQREHVSNMKEEIICPMCTKSHALFSCDQFRKLQGEQRFIKAKECRACTNCLRLGHSSKFCPSEMRCKKCQKPHHSMLHRDDYVKNKSAQVNTNAGNNTGTNVTLVPTTSRPRAHQDRNAVSTTPVPEITKTPSQPTTLVANVASNMKSVVLPLCYALACNERGDTMPISVMLDSCSDSDYIATRVQRKLNLTTMPHEFSITGIAGKITQTNHAAKCIIKSLGNDFSLKIEAPVLNTITSRLPPLYLTSKQREWIKGQQIEFSEAQMNATVDVDVLLGAEHFFNLLCGNNITIPESNLSLIESKLGWFAAGSYYCQSQFPKHRKLRCNLAINLEKFWELEEVPNNQRQQSLEERFAVDHFNENYSRREDGRFEVHLPFKLNTEELGNTANVAKARMLSVEKKMLKDPIYKAQYDAFMNEYLSLGHMSLVSDGIKKEGYYLPHHAVLRPGSTTTKLRTVFDGSAPPSKGKSLNDILAVGPTVQPNVLTLLLRFRLFTVAIVADIEKMYRQIKVNEKDAIFQQILWRFETTKPLATYRLNTVTYGLSSSPFHAVQCLMKLATECETYAPTVAASIRENFFMDDWVGGANSIEEAMNLQINLRKILGSAGFHLRKFTSNKGAALIDIPSADVTTSETVEFNMDSDQTAKALGIAWQPTTDDFVFSHPSLPLRETLTKRSILSDMSKFFDPLGLCSPIIIQAKTFLQELWSLKVDWDDPIKQPEIREKYDQIVSHLSKLYQFRVPRIVSQDQVETIELQGFCDASVEAYAAVLYLRSINKKGEIVVKLLCSKTKVTPTQTVSVPRLELCAALLLARLAYETAYELRITSVTLWSDSSIVLNWLQKLPRNLTTYVANRVAEIQNLSKSYRWKHINSQSNPADIPTRRITADELRTCDLWWSGPKFLQVLEKDWPPSIIEFVPNLPEQKSTTKIACPAQIANDGEEFEDLDIFNRFSSLTKLLRISAYVFRFSYNCTIGIDRISGLLTVAEIQAAKTCLIKIIQRTEFQETYEALLAGKPIEKGNLLFFHDPIFDEDRLIRVGGRLATSHLPYNTRHPILLPTKHAFTTLIIRHIHNQCSHAGPLLTHNLIRQEYWLVGNAKARIRKLIRECVVCCRYRPPQQLQPMMGQLPPERTTIATFAFETTGVDYAGPFKVKIKTSDKEFVILNIHVAVFVCFATKAIHLELIEDLTTESYVAAMRRFVSRRGTPQKMVSDNSTTFTRANIDITNLYEFLRNHAAGISSALASQNISWSFIPPRAPHMGGLWEAAVKSMKAHLKRVVGRHILTYLEFTTLIVQIEGILNCRPLTMLPTDPNDSPPLTPAHFLIGRLLHVIPDDNHHVDTPRNRWTLVQNMHQQFWSKWSLDYLNCLQQRTKWRQNGRTAEIGEIVLIIDENAPPSHWNMGRVVQLHPGPDNITRVVDLQTGNRILRRPVVKLVPLIVNRNIN